ncbi:hypothetical protein HWV62_25508 [Athelia sp. TMB]|nr:hypothetical protein HWV62_25508 [Athelia sp. TMB]
MSFEHTAIILLGPYDDFPHANGKMYAPLRDSLASTNTIANVQELAMAARMAQVPIFYGMHPLHGHGQRNRWSGAGSTAVPGDATGDESCEADFYDILEPKPSNGDVVSEQHWNHSAFANTDLDSQLKRRKITNVVIAGVASETCLESTARYAYELSYRVTILADATASTATTAKDTAATLTWPKTVHEVITVSEWAGALFHY